MTIGDGDVLVVVDVQNDFCVRYSAEDACRENFAVFVVKDACRGIDIDGSVAGTRASLDALQIPCISAGALAP